MRRPSIDVLSYTDNTISYLRLWEAFVAGLTVSRSALSRYPRLEPAKTHNNERIKATKAKSRGTTAVIRIAVDVRGLGWVSVVSKLGVL